MSKRPSFIHTFGNILFVAINFTDKDKGIITLRIESAPAEKVRVSIADSGHGIPAEYREKVFDKFC